MDRNEKRAFVDSFRKDIESSNMVILVKQTALTVAESTELRVNIRAAGANFKVVKNSLARIAVKGLNCESVADSLAGPTAFAYSDDPVASAKVISDFSKNNDGLEILCGSLSGEHLDAGSIHKLALLPSLDELRGKLVGLITSPAAKIASTVQAPASDLARVFSAYGSK